jgi:hypothetical protein
MPVYNTYIFSLAKGKYAYIESSYRQEGDRAQLTSKLMSGAKCMQFMYNMNGIYMGSINVVQAYGQIKKVLLNISGNRDRPWHKAVVNISDVVLPYKVGNIGYVYAWRIEGEMAVKLIRITT